MTAAQMLLQMLEKAKVAPQSHSDVRQPGATPSIPSWPSQRRHAAQSPCFMLVLSIDLGKVSKDLITRVTHKVSCASSSYRLGKNTAVPC